MCDVLFNTSDYSKILENYLKDDTAKYISAKIKPISEVVQGILGEHYQLKITYQQDNVEKNADFFVKTKPRKNKVQQEIVNRSPVFLKEIFLFEKLFKEFEKYGYDTSFAAKFYYSVPNETLVMQDLSKDNYQLSTRHQKFNMEQIQSLLKSLALYHGAGFAYERTKTKELGKTFTLKQEYPVEFQELFYNLYIHTDVENRYWDSNFILFDKLIDLLPQDENYKQKFKKLIKEAELCKVFVEETDLPKTCGHGDLWSNNMMFKYENNILKHCCLVDFQVSRYFYPSVDVILAIFSNTSAEFRAKHLQELYTYYYQTLTAILKNYGYSISDIMTREQYERSLKLVKVDVMTQVLTVNAIIYMPSDTLTKCVKNDDDSLSKILHGNKDKLAVEAYKKDEKFKQIMIESFYDFYEALVQKLL